ncbi:hypothetical protein DOTSEDRAFT_26907 [Dothistroma septosporum NZE10]|uniref:Uncharacterized protein n=1 Tax=Dothistroma septosporum (strain NZE10 / CBS 128990) TaxID=675120 RepID=N1PHE5_DOTSN|nr:hypothetical protein DOTSEDRAFT_26907 [Dothistroma septosporum NZE10]
MGFRIQDNLVRLWSRMRGIGALARKSSARSWTPPSGDTPHEHALGVQDPTISTRETGTSQTLPQDGREQRPRAESPRSPPTLSGIPAELRNMIYELTFAAPQGLYIDLIRACPPDKSLIYTCRHIHREARQILRIAYQKYWTTNHFFVDMMNDHNDYLHAVARFEAIDLQHIEMLTLYATKHYFLPGMRAYASLRMVHLSGIWSRYVVWVDDYWPAYRLYDDNYIMVRRAGYGAEFGRRWWGWCLQCDTADHCANVLRYEDNPMSLQDQIVYIVCHLNRETNGWLNYW